MCLSSTAPAPTRGAWAGREAGAAFVLHHIFSAWDAGDLGGWADKMSMAGAVRGPGGDADSGSNVELKPPPPGLHTRLSGAAPVPVHSRSGKAYTRSGLSSPRPHSPPSLLRQLPSPPSHPPLSPAVAPTPAPSPPLDAARVSPRSSWSPPWAARAIRAHTAASAAPRAKGEGGGKRRRAR
jgi:hypothetical protein